MTIHAIIGVRTDGKKTWYVRRSMSMKNYPGVWSLLSIQYLPEELPDCLDLGAAEALMQRMSDERLGGVPAFVRRYLTSGTCSDNPMGERVVLHLYEISLGWTPELEPEFYTDATWMLPEEYLEASEGLTCGLCMRLWSDHCFRAGLCDARFAPEPVLD